MKKLVRVTTVDLSLDRLIKGQLKFLSSYYDVVGVASDTGLLKSVGEREGVKVINVPMHREISLKNDIVSLWNLYKLFRHEQPDILHCNTPKGSLLGLIAGKMAGVPKRIYTVTGLRYQGATGLFRLILKTMERLSCLFATNVIPEGQGVLHCLKEDHITGKSLSVLHYGNINGIDTSFYSREEVPKIDIAIKDKNDKFTFVFVGRIVKDKGIHELVFCMRKLDCKLILVGSYEDGDPIAAEDKDFLMHSDKVEFVGWQDDIRPYLVTADALVFPSYREGFPNVPMQAGALDLPCIVTDINGCNEIIRDGINGTIIQPRNEEALYGAMEWYIEHPADIKRMAGNARKMIKERYEQKDVWKALLNFYQNLDDNK
jgi:glycosyltransferase involved in cell wall biosynthesis